MQVVSGANLLNLKVISTSTALAAQNPQTFSVLWTRASELNSLCAAQCFELRQSWLQSSAAGPNLCWPFPVTLYRGLKVCDILSIKGNHLNLHPKSPNSCRVLPDPWKDDKRISQGFRHPLHATGRFFTPLARPSRSRQSCRSIWEHKFAVSFKKRGF